MMSLNIFYYIKNCSATETDWIYFSCSQTASQGFVKQAYCLDLYLFLPTSSPLVDQLLQERQSCADISKYDKHRFSSYFNSDHLSRERLRSQNVTVITICVHSNPNPCLGSPLLLAEVLRNKYAAQWSWSWHSQMWNQWHHCWCFNLSMQWHLGNSESLGSHLYENKRLFLVGKLLYVCLCSCTVTQ